MIRVGINGFGRIGRCFFKNVLANRPNISVVAINDISEANILAQLLRFDTTYGRLSASIEADGRNLVVNNRTIPVYSQKNPIDIPWGENDVDIVIESTGRFTDAIKARDHRTAGARKVIISAPSDNADLTIVCGVNQDSYDPAIHHVVSNASCTTNCLAPMLDVAHKSFGVLAGHMVTAHAFTQDQNLQDGPHKDMRRARSAFQNIIPTSTGAAKAIGDVIPGLAGKINGYALRVPVITGSVIDLTVNLRSNTSVDEINECFRKYENQQGWSIIDYSSDNLVSSDIIGSEFSCVFDSLLTKVTGGNMATLVGWYDNEWGFSSRLADVSCLMMERG